MAEEIGFRIESFNVDTPGSSTKSSIENISLGMESKNEFHIWHFCEECWPSGSGNYGTYNYDYVLLDDSNFYGLTEHPGGYNTAAIAAASTVLYNAYGAPNVGEVVNIHTNYLNTPKDYCIQYLGTTATQQNPSYTWFASTQAQYTGTFSDCVDCCFGEEPSEFCYEIGDITDPADGLGGAGGMVFALPNTPPNNTPYYYEVALDDLSVGTTPVDSLIIDNVFPFTQTAFPDGQRECGQSVPGPPQAQLCFPISLTDPLLYPIDTTIGNTQARYPFGVGAPIDPCNPSGANISSITVSAPVTGVDFNNNPAWSSGTSPMLLTIEFIPANSANVPTTGQVVMSLPYDSYLFDFDTPMNNLTSALYLKQLNVLGGIATTQPFSTIGAEWGAYNDQLTLPTSVDFGEGLNNTSNILAQPATPVWPTHDVAANLCSAYNPPSSAPNRWFLPSLMEFHAIYTNVGPGTPHAAALNLHPQVEDLQDTYWTSSSLTGFIPDPTSLATTPPLIGGPSGTFSDPFAWAYNAHDPIVPYPTTISQNLPIGPNVITRCSTLSVRPVRRFECVQPVDPIDLSCGGNPCDGVCDGFFVVGNYWGASLNDLYFFEGTLQYDSNSGVLVATQAQLQTDINNSGDLEPGYTLMGVSEISRFGNRLWMRVTSYDFSQGASFNVDYGEWIVDTSQPTPTIFFNRLIKTDPSDYVGWQSGSGSGIDNCTFLIQRRYVGGGPNWDQYDICTVDVSGATAVITSLFPAPTQSTLGGVRDITHICDTDTYVYTNRPLNSPTDLITHVDSSGAVLGSVPIGTGALDVAFGICCFNGEVLVSRNYNNINEIYSVDLNTYTLGSTIFSGIMIGDLASNPICCPGCCGTEDPSADPCQYMPGDIGPAGGIIVATPYMNCVDPSFPITNSGLNIPPLQGGEWVKNCTGFYYEISPTNLNNTGEFGYTGVCAPVSFDSAQWGSVGIDIGDSTYGLYQDYWVPENNFYNFTGSYFHNEYVGEGKQATADMLAVNNGLPTQPDSITCNSVTYNLTPMNAFEMCDNFSLNGYNDWFLPTTEEMALARNYTPLGTLYDSTDGMATLNTYSPGCNWANCTSYYHYWTCNTMNDDSDDINLHNPFSFSWNTGADNGALTVSMGPIFAGAGGPDGEGWRTMTHRGSNNNVRAMRRFVCDEDPPPINTGIEYNYRVMNRWQIPGGSIYSQSAGRAWMHSSVTPVMQGNVPVNGAPDPSAITYKTDHIGDNHLGIYMNKMDVVGNIFASSPGLGQVLPLIMINSQSHVTIEAYSQHEEHLGTWLYKCMGQGGCGVNPCTIAPRFWLVQQLVQVNGLSVVNLWDQPSGQPGPHVVSPVNNEYAYLKFTIDNDTGWTSNNYSGSGTWPPLYGNTIDLEDYLGLGINNRTLPGQSVNNDWHAQCYACEAFPPTGANSRCDEWFAHFWPTGYTFPLSDSFADCWAQGSPCDGTLPPSSKVGAVVLEEEYPTDNECEEELLRQAIEDFNALSLKEKEEPFETPIIKKAREEEEEKNKLKEGKGNARRLY